MSDFLSESEGYEEELLHKLQEENEELKNKNVSYESQLQRLLEIVSQTEQVNQENTKSKAEIRKLKLEIADIQNRLENSNQQNKDLEKSLEEEKRRNQQVRAEELTSNSQEIEKLTRNYQQKISNQNDLIQKMREEQNNSIISNKLLNSKINKLLQAAQWHFNKEINSIELLTQIIEQEEPKQNLNDKQQQNQQQILNRPDNGGNCIDIDLLKMANIAKKYKTKAKNVEQKLYELENELVESKKGNEETKKALEQKVFSLQNELNNIKTENQLLKEQSKAAKEQLEGKINTLKSENTKLQADLSNTQLNALQKEEKQPQQVIEKKQKDKENIAAKIAKLESDNANLNNSLNDMKEKNQQLSKEKDEAITKLTEGSKERVQLQFEIEKQKSEINSLKMVNDEKEKEIETLRTALHSRQNKQEKEQTNQNHKQLKAKATLAEQQVKSLSARVEQLSKENSTLQSQVFQKDDELSDKKLQISSLQEQLKAAEKRAEDAVYDLHDMEMRMSKKPKDSIDDLLPPEAWRPLDYEQSIANKIDEIGRNKTLQPISKLHNIYKLIKKYYGEQLNDMNELYKDAVKQAEILKETVNKFIIDSSIALMEKAVTFDDVIQHNQQSTEFTQKIQEIRLTNDQLKHENERLTKILQSVQNAFPNNKNNDEKEENKVDTDFIIKSIKEINETYEIMKENLQESKDRRKNLKSELKVVSSKLEETTSNYDTETKLLKQKVEDLENNLNLTQKQLSDVRKKLLETTNELTRVTSESNDLRLTLEDREAQFDKSYKNIEYQVNSNQNVDVNHLQHRIHDLESKLKESQAQRANERQRCETLEKEVKNKENELQQVKSEYEGSKQSSEAKITEQKAHISESYEQAIKELKKQSDLHREDIQKLSEENAKINELLANEKQVEMKLKSQLRKKDSELKITKDQLEREKKLCEVTTRAKIIAAETKYNSKLEEHYSSAEAERRRIFSFAATSFKQFFVPSSQLDERSYKNLIKTVSDELNRLLASDNTIRAMLGAADSQTTEDAVAQFKINIQ